MNTLAKYGVAKTILFPLVDRGAVDFEATPVSHASGDTKISKDEGAFANTTNAFAHEGNGIYSLVLTATEMQAARIAVTIIDQGSKAWEDQAIILETYGNASAEHAFDLDTATQNVNVASVSNDAITAAAIATGAIDADAIADNAIDAGAIASDAITAAKIAADAIGASELAADAATEIATAVWASATRTLTALGFTLGASDLASDTITAAKIAADAIGASEIAADAITEIQSGLATAAALATLAAFVDTEVADILADTNDIQSRLPAALVGGRMNSDVGSMQNNAIGLNDISLAALGQIAQQVLVTPLIDVAGGYGDFRSLYGAVASLVNRARINGSNLEVYDFDDTTILATIPVTTDSGQDPIVELDPP